MRSIFARPPWFMIEPNAGMNLYIAPVGKGDETLLLYLDERYFFVIQRWFSAHSIWMALASSFLFLIPVWMVQNLTNVGTPAAWVKTAFMNSVFVVLVE